MAILRTLVKKSPLDDDVDLDGVARDARCTGYSGADMSALVREATIQALRGSSEKVVVTMANFDKALDRVPRSVTVKQEAKYLRLKVKMSRSRLGIQADDSAAGAPVKDRAPQVTVLNRGQRNPEVGLSVQQ